MLQTLFMLASGFGSAGCAGANLKSHARSLGVHKQPGARAAHKEQAGTADDARADAARDAGEADGRRQRHARHEPHRTRPGPARAPGGVI